MPYTYTSSPIATDIASVGNPKIRKAPIDTALNAANVQIDINTDEIEAARGGEASLSARLDGYDGGAGVSDARLIEWTEAGAYELTAVNVDADEVITTATVKWPDGSAGTFTTTTKNGTWLAVDAFTISHTDSGPKTVTQAAVTRNAQGTVITKPALTVA